METYRFHWEKHNELGLVSKGTFTVKSKSYEECLKIAEEEIQKHNGVLIYSHKLITKEKGHQK